MVTSKEFDARWICLSAGKNKYDLNMGVLVADMRSATLDVRAPQATPTRSFPFPGLANSCLVKAVPPHPRNASGGAARGLSEAPGALLGSPGPNSMWMRISTSFHSTYLLLGSMS